jgi:hypothetical protein
MNVFQVLLDSDDGVLKRQEWCGGLVQVSADQSSW